jgi:TRAP-type mannitol/chloroaromatic compound transport system permease large subunit
VRTSDILIGVVPFIVLIVLMCLLVALVPSLVTWLPHAIYAT